MKQRVFFGVVLVCALVLPVHRVCADDLLSALFSELLASLPGERTLTKVWTAQSGEFLSGAAEIVTFDPCSNRVFVSNASTNRIDVFHARTGAKVTDFLVPGFPNSVAAHDGLVAVACEGAAKTDLGSVALYNAHTCALIKNLPAGAQPDMVCFSPNGRWVVSANEGEPSDDYAIDPEGSITVIDLSRGPAKATARTASFTAFNDDLADLLAAGVRIYGPGASVAQDIEPEYVTIAPDSKTAYVTLQENNAVAVVDLKSARVLDVLPLGFKDHLAAGNELDPSDRDGGINIANWPVQGMFLPDSIGSYNIWGRTFLVTANEGDTRDWDGYSEEERVKDLTLDATAFPDASNLRKDAQIGRLKVTSSLGDIDGDGDYDELYSFGARSFSIWTEEGGALVRVFDSGSDFENLLAERFPANFNSNHEANDFDSRSDDKGPEPEALTVGRTGLRTFAFIGLERMGGILVYDVSNPIAPDLVHYALDRDFAGDPEAGTAGELGPEGLTFVPSPDSPFWSRTPLLVVSNEVSSTVTLYRFEHPAQTVWNDVLDALQGLILGN